MDISLEYYRIFYYAAKLGGITLAAEALSITQPAVSQAIRHLEKKFGTDLFIRTGKGVRLTNTGEVLYTYVRRGYEQICMGEQKVLEMVNLEAGEIRIGASDMTLRFYLLPLLQEFRERYPGIRLSVTNGPTPETMRYLAEGRIDFGLVTAPLGKRKGLHLTEVRRIQDVFVAGERFQELEGQTLSWDCLTRYPVVALEKHTSTRSYMDEFLLHHGISMQPEIELATSDMIVQFAQKNLGIACVVRDFAQEALQNGSLFELTFEEELPERSMYLVTSEKSAMTSASARFLGLLHENLMI